MHLCLAVLLLLRALPCGFATQLPFVALALAEGRAVATQNQPQGLQLRCTKRQARQFCLLRKATACFLPFASQLLRKAVVAEGTKKGKAKKKAKKKQKKAQQVEEVIQIIFL